MTDDPLGDILLFAAPLGIAGVFVMALFERIVPVLPSHGLFAAIGIAAAEGSWGLPAAIIASVLGSGTGAFTAYRIGIGIGIADTKRWPMRIRRLLRRRDRLGSYLRSTRRRSTALPFIAQLLPAVRLIAPLIGGAMPHDPRRLAIATLAGLAVWNVTFIMAGFAMVRLGGPTNATAASMTIFALLCCSFIAMRLIVRRRPDPATN